MHYLIDGYNLLYQVGVLAGRAGPSGLEKARRALLGRLSAHFGAEAANVTVIFDAARAPPTASDTMEYEGVRVHFTRHELADDRIEELIRRAAAPKDLTVVSNDRRIREAALRRRCRVVECVEFWASLAERPPVPEPPEGEAGRDRVSRGEVEEWAKEFEALESDPAFRELFDPYDFDDPP